MSDWLSRIKARAQQVLDEVVDLDADAALMASMAAMCELSATRYALEPGAQWVPGQPLKLLFAGYAGTRNTGADVRVEEMIRQVRFLLGDDLADLSILTIDPELSRGYFPTVKQLHLPQIFPRFVFDAVHAHHGVIACEGSMFKSKFANALSTLMVGALGCAVAENKIAIGYGGEAGGMDPNLERLVRRYCADSLIISRNANSDQILKELGVAGRVGTDTAWTYEAGPPEVAEALLREAGWDGRKPLVALCPINAFWWPVKPDVRRGLAWAMSGAHDAAHYDSIYFHHSGDDVDAAQDRYIRGIADGVRRFQAEVDCFPILVGMERLDRSAAAALNEALGGGHPLFISDDHDHKVMVSVIRRCDMLLSSRYHAIVCSMGGLVASAGITMDERIRNLMDDRGTPHLALEVDDPDLGMHVHEVLGQLYRERASIREGIGLCVVRNLELMGLMGQILVDYLRARHPALPIRPELGEHGDPWDHLPPLSPALQALVARHRDAA
jgi:polysaccharide pyruvyl transferase WcaK-like protein